MEYMNMRAAVAAINEKYKSNVVVADVSQLFSRGHLPKSMKTRVGPCSLIHRDRLPDIAAALRKSCRRFRDALLRQLEERENHAA